MSDEKLQGKARNVHDQLKFTQLIDKYSTNASPAWKDGFVVTQLFFTLPHNIFIKCVCLSVCRITEEVVDGLQ